MLLTPLPMHQADSCGIEYRVEQRKFSRQTPDVVSICGSCSSMLAMPGLGLFLSNVLVRRGINKENRNSGGRCEVERIPFEGLKCHVLNTEKETINKGFLRRVPRGIIGYQKSCDKPALYRRPVIFCPRETPSRTKNSECRTW